MSVTQSRIANEMHRLPNGRGEMPKVDVFDWKVVDAPGGFAMIHKSQLNVDHEYQRTKINQNRVLNIARAWCWAALGVLMVARRPDGSFWVFDGQHRLLAALKRTDIQAMPCMVFASETKVQEAFAYLKANTDRGPMRAIERFNALIMAGDTVATAAKAMAEATGYRITESDAAFTVRCVAALMSAVKMDASSASAAWGLCVEIYQGEPVIDRVFTGLFMLERHLKKQNAGSITEAHNRLALVKAGAASISRSIQEAVAYHGGGPKSCAEGIARLLNKGRSTRRIPTPHADE